MWEVHEVLRRVARGGPQRAIEHTTGRSRTTMLTVAPGLAQALLGAGPRPASSLYIHPTRQPRYEP
jgi:hypothetical protein